MGILRNNPLCALSQQQPEGMQRGSHRALCYRAGRYLVSTKRCQVVMVEKGCDHTQEMPDAIGWRGTESWLIEVKVSREDFLRDAKKPHRQAGQGMGMHRYYMIPKPVGFAIIHPDEVPEGWGLLEIDTANGNEPVKVIKPSKVFDDVNLDNERSLLISALKTPEKLFEFWDSYQFNRYVRENTGQEKPQATSKDFFEAMTKQNKEINDETLG